MIFYCSRLLGYAECVLKQEPICPWTEIATESDQHKDICVILKQAFEVISIHLVWRYLYPLVALCMGGSKVPTGQYMP